MANSKSKSNTKTTNNTKKAATKTAAKKATTKTVAKKATAKPAVKKTTAKKVATKPATKKVEPVTIKNEVKKTESKSFGKFLNDNLTLILIVILTIVVIINIIVVACGHKVELSNGKEVIAKLEGKEITAEELFETLNKHYGTDSLITIVDEFIVNKEVTDKEKEEARKKAQENLDAIKKQYQDAGYKWEDVIKSYGYANDDEILNEMAVSSEKEAIAKKYIKASLTDDDIKDYYDKNVYGKYTAKHILITPATTDTMTAEEKTNAENAAKAKAEEVISKLNSGVQWATLVNDYSQDTGSKNNEGLIENFTKGDVADEVFNAVQNLKDNEYTKEPVKSSYGYHVIVRVSYTEKEALKDIKDSIVDEIVTKKLSEDTNLFTTTWRDIRSKYKLDIKDTKIKENYDNKTKKDN